MKHFYMKAPDGAITRISDKDLDSWRAQGGFMNTEGPVLTPVALGRPEADAIEMLMTRGENFTFWFSPDYRIVLTAYDEGCCSGDLEAQVRMSWTAED
jgi:hypothetical protein